MKAIKDFWLFWQPNPDEPKILEEGNFFVPENGTVAEHDSMTRFSALKRAIEKVMPKVLTVLLGTVLLALAAASVYVVVKFITLL